MRIGHRRGREEKESQTAKSQEVEVWGKGKDEHNKKRWAGEDKQGGKWRMSREWGQNQKTKVKEEMEEDIQ